MKPNFLIVGPPKCASTSLYYYLNQHPEVYLSKVKETHFFSNHYHKGIEFYEHYFDGAGNAKAIGEATPSYSFLPFAADRIKNDYPNIKLIFCFRNPMERAFSQWLMQRDSGVEKAGFIDAIKLNIKQLDYINFNGEKGAAIWTSRADNIDAGEKWVRIYVQAGMYAAMMKSYFERFKKEQIKCIFIEDLRDSFNETMKDLFAFIGVDENFVTPVKEEKNFYYNRKIYRALSNLIGIKNIRLISSNLPKLVKNNLKQKKQSVKEIPKISKEERLFLWNIYKADIQELEHITGKKLCHWMPDNNLTQSISR
jgi:hypothetical protein